MKKTFILLLIILSSNLALADMKYDPISFNLSTEKESYYESEKVTFLITIKNKDKENSYPVLIPHTQNSGQKLFCFNVYDKANNTLLLRFSEDPLLKMMVHDTGTVKIIYLKPLEEIVIRMYWNDFEGNNNYQLQNSSHHSFGTPLFAGIYKINVLYQPNGIALGDSIYNYYNNTEEDLPANGKLDLPANGDQSNFCFLKIRKSKESILSIEGIKYYTQWDKDRNWCWYYIDSIGNGGSNERLVHITNLPIDSFSLPKGEYFYTHFTNKFAEVIVRFDDGDIKEYRKYRDNCPEELFTERYNDVKQKTYNAVKLPDGRFYNITYNQPGGTKHQEMYYAEDGSMVVITNYTYTKSGKVARNETVQTLPCVSDTLEGKKDKKTNK